MHLLFRTISLLHLLFIGETAVQKRILVEDTFYTLVSKLNALEKEVAALKATTASNNTLQSLKQDVALLKSQQAKQTTTVAFMAYLTKHEHGTNHHIYFDDVKTNIGNAYNPIHGMFVAPVDGRYQFSVTSCSEGGHYIVLELTRNNENLGKLISGDDAFGDCNSKAFIVKLAARDYVFVQHKVAGEWLLARADYVFVQHKVAGEWLLARADYVFVQHKVAGEWLLARADYVFVQHKVAGEWLLARADYVFVQHKVAGEWLLAARDYVFVQHKVAGEWLLARADYVFVQHKVAGEWLLAARDYVFVQHKVAGEWLLAQADYGFPSFSGFLIKAS